VRPDTSSSKSIAKSSREAYLEATTQREETNRQKLQTQKELLDFKKLKLQTFTKLERDRFNFEKLKYFYDKSSRDKEIGLEILKAKVKLAKLGKSSPKSHYSQ
jgi:hypothetical protein